MLNPLDFDRLSDHVNSIVDRKLIAITTSLSSSSGYLRTLINQAYDYTQESLNYSSASQTSATNANTSATTSLMVLNEFTSTYLGVSATEPQNSSQGNSVNVGGFYIRATDGRIRYVTGLDGSGNPVYADTTVTADPASLAAAGAGIFLSLQTTSLQTVKSPVTFQNTLLGPRVTSWTSQQLATATDVNDRVNTVQTALTNEINRATAAESSIGTGKVSKTGDTMSNQLQIVGTGENPSLVLRNSAAGSGRIWRAHSTESGFFRIVDETSNSERMTIAPNGDVVIMNSLTVNQNFATKNLYANSTDANDSGLTIQKNGVNRWFVRRSDSAGRFYISRFNASGVNIDTPFYIAESDGTVYTNKLVVSDTVQLKNSVTIEGAGASVIINNTNTAFDNLLIMKHSNVSRWSVGRDPRVNRFFINRFNDSGVFVDTPLFISETTGWVGVTNVQASGVIQASTSISAPIVYAQANGTGRSIAVGDDAWIGDANIPNGLSIRGQTDQNVGYIRFGNSTKGLGCNAGDNILRYDNNTVWHAGNLNPSEYVRVVQSSNSENGGYRIYSDGYKECWGKITVVGNAQSVAYSFPVAVGFTLFSNVVISGSSGGVNAQDNFVAIANCTTTGFTVNNPDDSSVTAWYQAKGY